MIKFKVNISYDVAINNGETIYSRHIDIDEIEIDESQRHKFYIQKDYNSESIQMLNMETVMEIVLNIYNAVYLTEYNEDKIFKVPSGEPGLREKTKKDIVFIRQLFGYICMMEGYTVREYLEFLGYNRSVIQYSKLLENRMNKGDEAAIVLYKSCRKVLNKLAQKINLLED